MTREPAYCNRHPSALVGGFLSKMATHELPGTLLHEKNLYRGQPPGNWCLW